MLTSVILTCYNQTPFQAHMTMACIANITRYTPPDDYELILVSGNEKFPVRDDYHVLKIDKYIKNDLGYTAAMNYGAKQASGDVFVFLQNDVFVYRDWIRLMRWYVDGDIADCVIPDQVPRSYEEVLRLGHLDMFEATKYGSRDAGCLMIKKESFEKMGGWREDLSLLAEKEFYERMSAYGVRQVDTCKVMITHIMAATNLDRLHKNPEEYEKMMSQDAQKLK